MPILFSSYNRQTFQIQSSAIAFATHVWVNAKDEPTPEHAATLCALLDAQPNPVPSSALSLAIRARTGTQSPWASKAADIVALRSQ